VKALLPRDLIAKLDELAEQPGPKDLKRGAMCYSIAPPPNREEYICPKCGERTLYAKSGGLERAGIMVHAAILSTRAV
jgi:hypothetical protein